MAAQQSHLLSTHCSFQMSRCLRYSAHHFFNRFWLQPSSSRATRWAQISPHQPGVAGTYLQAARRVHWTQKALTPLGCRPGPKVLCLFAGLQESSRCGSCAKQCSACAVHQEAYTGQASHSQFAGAPAGPGQFLMRVMCCSWHRLHSLLCASEASIS